MKIVSFNLLRDFVKNTWNFAMNRCVDLWEYIYRIGIAIPWLVRMYVEIIHQLQRVDYLTHKRSNMVQLFYTTYISVDLAHHEIFRAKAGKDVIIVYQWSY